MKTPSQSATGAVATAAAAPASDVEQALYEARRKIYPRAVTGWFATWRWTLVALTQAVFYGLAWLPWNGRQAVLFDLAHRKFFIFGLVLWPQDIVYLTVLLVLSALSLFLFTAIAGRLFCGYACPQTVYTELFTWIERRIEGDRNARMKLDAGPITPRKIARKSAKHAAWLLLAAWTGFTFVGYFTPIQTLAQETWTLSLGGWEAFWILFYGFATYGNAGFMREQVCKYMCPYARFQSAMFDKDTLVIAYDRQRGDPRGSRSRKADPRSLGLGDCVDCGLCVEVCPTGIDIREGLQYECIGCGGCIDACNQIMSRMGYPKGLIRYSTENAVRHAWSPAQIWRRVARPRVLIYSALLCTVAAGAVSALALRVPLKVDVIRDRAALAREAEDGTVENVYRLQVMNTEEQGHRYRIEVEGIDGIALGSQPLVEVPPAAVRTVVVEVHVPPGHGVPGSNRIRFGVAGDDGSSTRVVEKSVFLVPR
jgi:cytochrome c oxidase accessory protein FixG